MGQQQIAGLIGAVMILGGVFSPILRGPIIGRVTYLEFSRGEAIVATAFALIAVLLVLFRRPDWVWLMGTGALATLAYSFIRIQVSLSGSAPVALKKLLNSPFEGINQMMRHAMQIDWGWGLLLGGAILVIAAGNIKGYRV